MASTDIWRKGRQHQRAANKPKLPYVPEDADQHLSERELFLLREYDIEDRTFLDITKDKSLFTFVNGGGPRGISAEYIRARNHLLTTYPALQSWEVEVTRAKESGGAITASNATPINAGSESAGHADAVTTQEDLSEDEPAEAGLAVGATATVNGNTGEIAFRATAPSRLTDSVLTILALADVDQIVESIGQGVTLERIVRRRDAQDPMVVEIRRRLALEWGLEARQ